MLYAITAVNAWHTTNTNRLCLHILQTHTHIQNQYLVYHSAAGAFILRQKKTHAKIAQENNINSICRVCHLHANKKQTLYKPHDL